MTSKMTPKNVPPPQLTMTDIIIIGAGPAGLTAGIYARRAEKSVLILEKGAFGGQMTFSPQIDNYPGIPSASGVEIADRMVEQALSLGVEIEVEEVVSVDEGSEPDYIKRVTCESGEVYEARAVIIAAGAEHRHLGVPGEDAHIGAGISFCAVCDGAFYRGRNVAVVGGGNSALQEALMLSGVCGRVTILQNLPTLTGEQALRDAVEVRDNIDVICSVTVAEVLSADDGAFGGLVIEHADTGDRETVSCDGAFVAIGLAPKNAPFESVTSLDEAGYILSDESCFCETPGVFVAGDCRTKSVRQITTAVSDGAAAALAACRFLG